MAELKMEEERARRKKIARKRKKRNTIIILTLSVFLALAIASTVFMVYMYNEMNRKAMEANEKLNELEDELNSGKFLTTEEADAMAAKAADDKETEFLTYVRSTFENDEGTLTVLEHLYPNTVVVPNTSGYRFFDIDDSLNKKTWKDEAFVYPEKDEESGKYEGRASYDDGSVTARLGIDVSKFQGDIDWNKVKSDGVEYAYMRLGYRGYEEGGLFLDSKYEDNIEGCNNAGLDCGVYFFTEALTEKEAVEEAEYVLENIADYHVELPIVIDVETSANPAKSRTKDMTSEQRTKNVIAFCERIKEAGYEPMIYGNLKSMMIMLDFPEFEEYDKWFAYYRSPIRFPYKIKMWQYTSGGQVNGVGGDVDMNLMFY